MTRHGAGGVSLLHPYWQDHLGEVEWVHILASSLLWPLQCHWPCYIPSYNLPPGPRWPERGCNIRKCLVDQWLCSLKQIFSEVGTTDTQIKSLENINFCLCQQLAKYQEGNPSPTCFHPILLSLFLHLRSLYASSTTAQYAITNIYLLTFFYLLCLR